MSLCKGMTRFRFFACFFLLSMCWSCRTTVRPVKPEEAYLPQKTVYDRHISYLTIPVEITYADIEKQVNSYVKGLLYEDDSYENNGGDGLICRVKKQGNIRIEGLANRIRVTIPLDIWGKYRTLGVTTEFEGILSATYISTLTLEDDWKLKTLTKSAGHEWIKSPTIDMYLFKLPVTAIANAAIKGQQNYITGEIDRVIREQVDLKEYAGQLLSALYEPVLVSETYRSWFRMEPLEILTTQIHSEGQKMRVRLGLKAYTETLVGQKPEKADTSVRLPMKVVEDMPDEFNVGLVTLVKYPDASQLLKEQFVQNPYTYTDGRRSVTLTHIDLWGQNEKVVIEVGLTGSLHGMIYLTGTPYYEEKSRTIRMKDMDFHLDTRNKLLKSADWLLHGKFARMMQQYMYFEIGKQLDEAKKECQRYLSHYEISKGVFLEGELLNLEASKVYMVQDAFVAVVNAKGKIAVKVEGM